MSITSLACTHCDYTTTSVQAADRHEDTRVGHIVEYAHG